MLVKWEMEWYFMTQLNKRPRRRQQKRHLKCQFAPSQTLSQLFNLVHFESNVGKCCWCGIRNDLILIQKGKRNLSSLKLTSFPSKLFSDGKIMHQKMWLVCKFWKAFSFFDFTVAIVPRGCSKLPITVYWIDQSRKYHDIPWYSLF